ncbi:MAG: mannose-1-phosphate guanylyltransferase/mannose-6-phosphate isomerase [Gammaproteobacteria bacterium RIFCSPHIGHO2_12_FULL_43_28]|nr:MAG: mannose-1-phosphate guanylyltransferase/mannose-6-phosphate isomerase [Gammaproteobacteria bacterium RIFCSPHIGHO2_12_FULL_43_28]
MAEQPILVPVILSGGTGSRLWPISRESHPKPFMVLPDKQSLLQKTYLRAHQLPHAASIITITNASYYFKTCTEYDATAQTNLIPQQFLLEPVARNTAPAIALCALFVQHEFGPDAILLVQPADHLIEDTTAFIAACKEALKLADENKIVTFGMKPTRPETGFGYIECGETIPTVQNAYDVRRFIEKPAVDVAEMYMNDGRYLWNAGIFCFKASTLLSELEIHAPALLTAATHCLQETMRNTNEEPSYHLDKTSFEQLPSISIDYALMEKSSKLLVIACDFNWQDIGSWEHYRQLYPADKNGNTVIGNAILKDANNNFIFGNERVIASIGINDLAIIDTPDALLISHRDKTQDVKHIVNRLKEKAHESYLTHRTVIRPWGTYTVLEEGFAFKIKRIVVKPQHSLSLQLHHHRSEHWIVVLGIARVVNADKTYDLKTNESTFVPMQTPHRLSNPGESDLIIIEVQTGSYLGEDDIVRFEDTYGRIT